MWEKNNNTKLCCMWCFVFIYCTLSYNSRHIIIWYLRWFSHCFSLEDLVLSTLIFTNLNTSTKPKVIRNFTQRRISKWRAILFGSYEISITNICTYTTDKKSHNLIMWIFFFLISSPVLIWTSFEEWAKFLTARLLVKCEKNFTRLPYILTIMW